MSLHNIEDRVGGVSERARGMARVGGMRAEMAPSRIEPGQRVEAGLSRRSSGARYIDPVSLSVGGLVWVAQATGILGALVAGFGAIFRINAIRNAGFILVGASAIMAAGALIFQAGIVSSLLPGILIGAAAATIAFIVWKIVATAMKISRGGRSPAE